MRVCDVLSTKGGDVLSIRADRPLAAAVALMAARKVGSIVVLDASGRPLGIVSEPDIVAAISAQGAACLGSDTRLALRTPAARCAPNDTVTDALARMTRDRIRYLLVVDADAFKGLVSIGDLVKARLETTELESRVLRDMARGRLLEGA